MLCTTVLSIVFLAGSLVHGTVATKVIDTRDFGMDNDYGSVQVFGGLKIVIHYGNGISIKGPSLSVTGKIKTSVHEKELVIRPVHLSNHEKHLITVTVNFNASVRWPKVTVNDGSHVHVVAGKPEHFVRPYCIPGNLCPQWIKVVPAEVINEVEFVVNASQITAQIVVNDVISRIYGTGIITLSGMAVRSFVGVWGSGLHNAADLKASERVEIYIKGSGVLSMWTSYTAGYIDGAGLIRYRDIDGVFNSTNVSSNGFFQIVHL